MPDEEIQNDVRQLTGEDGEIVFLSIGRKDKYAGQFRRLYDMAKPGAVLTDEFGNLLKGGMKTSEEIADSFYEIDYLFADQFQTWTEAIEKGTQLLEKKNFEEAAKVLRIFAFAAGTKEAEQGRKLFERIARIASEEFESLAAEIEENKSAGMNENTRKAMMAKMAAFIEKWPRTPAAFSAEAIRNELSRSKGSF